MILCLYTMGRVGTMAVKAALDEENISSFNVHNLITPGSFLIRGTPNAGMVGRIRKKHFPIVTLVRDPIARNLSAYYLHKERYLEDDDHRESFLINFPHEEALRWFDDEFFITTGVDFYWEHFDKSLGYRMLISPFHNPVLIMRTDKLSAHSQDAFEDFIGVRVQVEKPERVLSREEAYDDFLEEVLPLPASYIEEAYSHIMFRHFFTPSEKAELFEKWSSPWTYHH